MPDFKYVRAPNFNEILIEVRTSEKPVVIETPTVDWLFAADLDFYMGAI